MDRNRFKATVVLSSDHAGINDELSCMECSMLHVLARIDDPRKARDYIRKLIWESEVWCTANTVDNRGWMERTRKARA